MTSHSRKNSNLQQQNSTPFRNITSSAINLNGNDHRKRNHPKIQQNHSVVNNENMNLKSQLNFSQASQTYSQLMAARSFQQASQLQNIENIPTNEKLDSAMNSQSSKKNMISYRNLNHQPSNLSIYSATKEEKLISMQTISEKEYSKTIQILEKELKNKDRQIQDLQKTYYEAKLEIELKTNQNKDLSKWLQLMVSSLQSQLSQTIGTTTPKDKQGNIFGSILNNAGFGENTGQIRLSQSPNRLFNDAISQNSCSSNSENFSIDGLITKINNGLSAIDSLRVENFNLKKQIAFDKKKYIDLKNSFIQMRKEFKSQEQEFFKRQPELKEIFEEKANLQNTLKVLTEEVEFLSKKNEGFLKELKKKNFYDAYKQQSEELTKLREAHALLINMIQTKDLAINKSIKSKTPIGQDKETTFSSLLTIVKNNDNNEYNDHPSFPLRRLLSCKNSTSHSTVPHTQMVHGSKVKKDSILLTDDNSIDKNSEMGQEDYEALESVNVQDIDQYLHAVLSRYRGSQFGSGINFLDQPSSKNVSVY